MIGRLWGRLAEFDGDCVIIDVGGVGYRAHVPQSTLTALPKLGQEVSLVIHTHVREDAILLYGFATQAEKDLFERLIGVSGVGPKLALAILSSVSPDRLRRAVMERDLAVLTAVSGVGKKTAERLLLELKDRLGAVVAHVDEGFSTAGEPADDALEALLALGYSRAEASHAVERALRSLGGRPETQELVRYCLRLVGTGEVPRASGTA